MNSSKTGVTIFIPLYNEAEILEENVVKLIGFLDHLKRPYEIILGSNGSEDNTPDIGRQLESIYSSITFFHRYQRGPGLSFQLALEKAVYPYTICQDADLSTDLQFIPRALDILKECDAVIGEKHSNTQKRPLFRIVASEFFIICTNFLLHMPYRDYSIGAKAYRTAAIRPLKNIIDRHTFYTQALIYHLHRSGKRIIEIPVVCYDMRKSKFNLLHEGLYRYTKLVLLWQKNLRR